MLRSDLTEFEKRILMAARQADEWMIEDAIEIMETQVRARDVLRDLERQESLQPAENSMALLDAYIR